MVPANGPPKPCPLTVISPHQFPYSKNFRQDCTCLSDQSLRYSFHTELKYFLCDKDLYLALGSCCSGSFKWLFHSVHTHTCTHITHTHTDIPQGKRSSLSASPTRVMIIITVGNSHHAPLLDRFLKGIGILLFFLPRRSEKCHRS